MYNFKEVNAMYRARRPYGSILSELSLKQPITFSTGKGVG